MTPCAELVRKEITDTMRFAGTQAFSVSEYVTAVTLSALNAIAGELHERSCDVAPEARNGYREAIRILLEGVDSIVG